MWQSIAGFTAAGRADRQVLVQTPLSGIFGAGRELILLVYFVTVHTVKRGLHQSPQTLTDQDTGDPSQVAPLLNQIDDPIGQVTADGAYDGAHLPDVRAGIVTVTGPGSRPGGGQD
jgi:hypothetical protein